MPANNSTTQACGDFDLIPKSNTTTYAPGSITTTGNIITSINSVTANWIPTVGYLNSNISTSTISLNSGFRMSKDGEVRIDPETGESSIFISEYCLS